MTQPRFVNSAFDPNQCPLLQGLSPEEQQQRMAEDPMIRQCIGHMKAKGAYPGPCSHLDPVPKTAVRPRRTRAVAALA